MEIGRNENIGKYKLWYRVQKVIPSNINLRLAAPYIFHCLHYLLQFRDELRVACSKFCHSKDIHELEI
jgi:hypothetical protein